MKRFIKLNSETKYIQYNDKSWSFDIEVYYQDLALILTELQLLAFNLTESCTFVSSSSKIKSVIFFDKDKKQSVVERHGSKFQITLNANDFEIILSYLLKYYRDSLAPVDHVDIEVEGCNDLTKNGSIVIKTFNSIESISGDEAKKILDLD